MLTNINKMLTKKLQKVASNFYCEKCDYTTSRKSSYAKHLTTLKHTELTSVNIESCNNVFICDKCKKEFKSRVGIWKHNKKCKIQPTETLNEEFIMKLVQHNSEIMKEHTLQLKDIVMEIVKNGINNTITTHTNSHNKAFNLNFFLNETCKNAMNITDFVDSIKLQLSDFMEVGELGYVEGISNIIIKNLNSLDETVRPIHCTDKKRETIYIKDENKWEKEDDDMKKIRRMIKRVAYKNERLMTVYKEKYPDYNNPESKRSDHYSKTVIEALGGIGENDKEKESKIIRNICKATQINKL